MSWYSRRVFPLLCDWALGSAEVAELRKKLLQTAVGRVLEIGFGTGLNLPHYPPQVENLVLIEPNEGMHRRAWRRLQQASIGFEVHRADGQDLPFDDQSFDTVVSTFTLCSIPNVAKALAECHRVLRSGGRFLYLEHGLSPDPAVQRWQRRLNRLQMWLGDGCHLDRDIASLVRQQPFAEESLQQFYLARAPRTLGYLYRGIVRRR